MDEVQIPLSGLLDELGVVGLALSSPPGFLARGLRIRQVTFRMGSELDE